MKNRNSFDFDRHSTELQGMFDTAAAKMAGMDERERNLMLKSLLISSYMDYPELYIKEREKQNGR